MRDTAEHNAHPPYRKDIDGLRALAIFPVVGFHAAPNLAPGGFVGVDIFFVISGFLISSIIFRSLANGDFSFIEFYASRVRRIFPALIMVLASCLALGWFALLADEFKQLGRHTAAAAGFVQNFQLWREAGYFDSASELKPLMHLWSLSIEEQFYLIYPFLIWVTWRLRINILVVLVMLGLWSWYFNISGIDRDVIKTFFVPYSRFWELIAGGAIAYFHVMQRQPIGRGSTAFADIGRRLLSGFTEAGNYWPIYKNILACLGLLLILFAIYGYSRSQTYPGWRALIPVLGACFLIISGPSAWVNRRLLANKPMIWIGLISYPLYLWHWPLLSFVRIMEEETPSQGMRAIAVMLSFVLAALTFQFIEKPVRLRRGGWYRTAILCALVVLLAYAGHYVYSRDGLAFRVAEVARNTAMFEQKTVQGYVDDACKQRYGDLNPGFCRLGKNTKPTILLAGDSHGAALFSGLRDVLEKTQDNVVMLGNGGCVPFYGVTSYANEQAKQYRRNCSDTITGALRAAEADAAIHTVILASSGPLYLLGPAGGRYKMEYITHPEIADRYEIWEAAMRDTLARLLANGKRVIVVLDNPELRAANGLYFIKPSQCVETRPLRITDKVLQRPCATSAKGAYLYFKPYRDLMHAVLKDFPAVKVVDVMAILCDGDWCWAQKDDLMLYHDATHLSLEGSRMVAPWLAEALGIHGAPASTMDMR